MQGSQRSLELNTNGPQFADFVEQEVLPLVSRECGLKLTTRRDQRVVLGQSSGAATPLVPLLFRFLFCSSFLF